VWAYSKPTLVNLNPVTIRPSRLMPSGKQLRLFHVALQPTTLCNLNCGYCYLPQRNANNVMSLAVAERVAAGVAEMKKNVRLVWHAGEPLACGIKHFRRLLECFGGEDCAPLVTHSLQTNATLINDQWCELFNDHGIEVGVSIDGPGELCQSRVDWNGTPALKNILRGIDCLRKNGIYFAIIAVVGERSLAHAREIYDFACEVGCSFLGVNIEETEGPFKAKALDPDNVVSFWRDLYFAWRRNPLAQVREFARSIELMMNVVTDAESAMDIRTGEIFPSVSVNGDVVLLSPELVDNAPHFRVGNILQVSLPEIIERAHSTPYVVDYVAGLKGCHETCGYFSVCGGGAASNRYFEKGRLNVTETECCKNRVQLLTDALLGAFGEENEAFA